jgi:hypothetical protein
MDNSAFQTRPAPKPQAKPQNDSILESLRALGSGVGKTVAKDVSGKIASDALASLFGAPVKPQGEMSANRPIQFAKERQPIQGFRRPEMAPRAPFVHVEEPQLKQQIESIRMELKALSASMKSLNTEIEKAINDTPVNPGVYHKNFMDRLRSVLQLLREQIDDSQTWLSLSNGRKQKKGYWGSYKKHGTSFGLSNERTMATQAG